MYDPSDSHLRYDTQTDLDLFDAAIAYISRKQNRTEASPAGNASVFIAEYGLAQNKESVTLQIMKQLMRNVVNTALSAGVRYVLFWETFDNECIGGTGCKRTQSEKDNGLAGRCHDANSV